MNQIIHAPIPLELGACEAAQLVAGGCGLWKLVGGAQDGAVEGKDLLSEEEGREGERWVGTACMRRSIIANARMEKTHVYVLESVRQ